MSTTPKPHPQGDTMSQHAKETANRVASNAGEMAQDAAKHYVQAPAQDLFGLAKSYAKDNPDVAACWAFALGVIVGWKLKP
ncbi:hypothetical protein Pla52o_14200 [Novipirellula galeiformis]|uniref:DUF883 domain-containing protein n=2 Tax=Novipirellula galeiformis TaxID=2528004 RepID=A0A5C6CL21_9BACT|nr:hypothetical protein Pla52o_14200 [Novipirellula galeiformis]